MNEGLKSFRFCNGGACTTKCVCDTAGCTVRQLCLCDRRQRIRSHRLDDDFEYLFFRQSVMSVLDEEILLLYHRV